MSESALRATPSVNIDEFERRLRATGSLGAAQDDPLAELARLLGAEEPSPKRAVVDEAKPPLIAVARPAPQGESLLGRVVTVDFGGDHTGGAADAQRAVPSQERPQELSAATPPPIPTLQPPPLPPRAAPADAASRPRRKVWPMAALILIGAVGAGGAWAYRSGVGLSVKVPPFIMAVAGPTKVQPPSQDTVSSPNDIASLLARDQQTKSQTATVVSNQEQPVDLNQRAKAQAIADAHASAPPANPPTIAPAPLVVVASPAAPAASAANGAVAGPAPSPAAAQASATPSSQPPSATASGAPRAIALVATPSPVAPSDAAPVVAAGTVGPTVAQPAPPAPFPEPKRVKTVAVRPDGSVIDSAAPADAGDVPPTPAAQQPVNPPRPVARPNVDASSVEPATPKLDLPAKSAGKATTRVQIAKIDTTAATGSAQSPEAPLQISPVTQREPKKREATPRVAALDSTPAPPAPQAPAQDKTENPVKSLFDALTNPQPNDQAATERAPIRTAATENPPAAGAGAFAVQLGAPRSEAEAQTMLTRLQSKFSGELGGLQPTIRKAEVKDKTVYRLRVGGLSRGDAVALCEKLKTAGGSCFLARE